LADLVADGLATYVVTH